MGTVKGKVTLRCKVAAGSRCITGRGFSYKLSGKDWLKWKDKAGQDVWVDLGFTTEGKGTGQVKVHSLASRKRRG